MPYASVKELPPNVRKMPAHAQAIFRSVFNAALKQYGTESQAFAVAYTAVKRSYKKTGGRWVKK